MSWRVDDIPQYRMGGIRGRDAPIASARTRIARNAGRYPGDDATVNLSQCRFWRDGSLTEFCVTTAGPVFRQLAGSADDEVPETIFNWPAGEAGSTADWVACSYLPWLLRESDVRADATKVKVLQPE